LRYCTRRPLEEKGLAFMPVWRDTPQIIVTGRLGHGLEIKATAGHTGRDLGSPVMIRLVALRINEDD